MELILIVVVTSILTLLVELTTGVPRIVLGAVFLLFFPGYSLIAALFPRNGSMQGVERAVLSFVLSVALAVLVAFILNFTPWGIRLESIFVAIASFVVVCALIALLRRRRLPESEQPQLRLHIRIPRWQSGSRLDMAISILLVILILAGAGALYYAVTAPRGEEPFTDFFVLGSGGLAEDYPRQLVFGTQAELLLGIVNHEHQPAKYRIEVVLNGGKTREIGPLILANEERWEEKVGVVPSEVGEGQKVEFRLYKGSGTEPYLSLHLWLDVREKE